MPDVRISQLPEKAVPARTDTVIIEDSTGTKKSSVGAVADSATAPTWDEVTGKPTIPSLPSDAEIGEKAFDNVPSDLTDDEKKRVRERIGAGTGSVDGSHRGAGDGLALSGNDLDVNPGDGIEIASDKVKVKAGTGITVDSDGVAVTNPFTDADEAKLDGIEAGAEVNVQPDWDASGGDAQILNKPTIPTVPARAGAFTAADETKLDGIEAGAEVNPRHVALPFRTEDGADADVAGIIEFIKSDNSQWQGGSSSEIAAIEINPDQYTLSQNPQVDNAAYTGWHSLADDLIANGGSSIWTFQRIGDSSPFAPIAGSVMQVQAETLVKNNDGNYVLSNIVHLAGHAFASGTGYNWQVVSAFAPPTGADAVVGVIARSRLPSDTVYREQLEGSETDRFASYNNAMVGNSYRAGDWVLTSDTSGAPTAANQIGQPDIQSASGTVCFGRLRTDADPNDLKWDVVPDASGYSTGDVIYASIDGDKGSHVAITLTSDGTLVGTGDGAYVYARATWVETGNIADVPVVGDYFRLGRKEPSTLHIELPSTDILGAPWVRRDGQQLTDADIDGDTELATADSKRLSLSELYEHHDQTHTGLTELSGYRFRTGTATPDKGDVAAPAAVGATGSYYIKAASDADEALIRDAVIADKRVRFMVSDTQYIEFRPSGKPGKLFGRLVGTYPAASRVQVGAALTDDVAVSVEIESNIAARDELTTASFKEKLSGQGGKVIGVNSGGDDTEFVDTTPSVSSLLTVTASWQEIEDGFSADDVVEICSEGAYSSESSNIALTSCTFRFGDLSTSSRWLGIRANAQGARIEIRRNGDAVEARTQGSVANCKAWTVTY